MRILYDYQALHMQRYGGVSRYYYELASNFSKRSDMDVDVVCVGNTNFYFESYFNKKSRPVPMKGAGLMSKKLALMKAKKCDIFHPTYYNPYMLGATNAKVVVTVYDMIHELMPEHFTDDTMVVPNKKAMLYGADHIIAISESTKRDILKLYPDIPSDKITVIYIGSNMNPDVIAKSAETGETNIGDITLPSRYILFVGTRDRHKNFKTFFEGVKPILTSDDSLHLVCIGGGAFKDSELTMFGSLAPQIEQHNATDALLAHAYHNAICFVFPSLYEGFGIPTLEAFACDCPVILSNTSSMPEVGGDAAVYIDPTSASDIEARVREVLGDSSKRDSMIALGREQLKKFNWSDIIEQTRQCYEKVLGK